ncbi:prolactin receptor b [Genypterus blacodes]|uniref:prolactin receptor b n=1 Tax=Genypterus blacodes TaxID=154954 RepID=UPI003F76496B
MRRDGGAVLLLLLSVVTRCYSASPPGKPVLVSCRSPEKETFTCWWEPGSDGGLSTKHRLYYDREDLEGTYECPDYQSAGRNSCFFDKKHTFIWVTYSLRVVASNSLGNATSDPLDVDVMYIMQPDAPEKVTLLVEEGEESPYLQIRWEPPHGTDTRSGWVTITYQVRVKEDKSNKWEEYMSGKQSHFVLYGLHPGAVYMVQVRCQLDHSKWSEWSNATYRKIPEYNQNGGHLELLASILCAVAFTAIMCVLIKKRKCVRLCLLPPVPGPKIRDFDTQLIKHHEDISSLINNPSFPPIAAWKDQMEDLSVLDNDDGALQNYETSLIVQNGFNSSAEIQTKESALCLNDCEAEGSKMEPAAFMKNRSLVNSGYVDIERQENIQEADGRQEDYSKVSGANRDNLLFLQRESVSLSTSCGDKGICYVDRTNQKQKNAHTTKRTNADVCADVPDSGYVDVSLPPHHPAPRLGSDIP